MKKIFLVFPMLILLTACGTSSFNPAAVAEHYGQTCVQGAYTVTTHEGFYTQYRLNSQTEGEQTVVTILEPASVAGIRAVLQAGQTRLQYEDASVDALLPQVEGYAPMDVLYGIQQDLQGNIPVSACVENGTVTMDYQETLPDGIETRKQITLREEDFALLSAELYLDGDLILTLTMEETPQAAG